jgi:hypothetical protein
MMPGRTEYLHAVQIAVDGRGLRYQVLDTAGVAREWAEWPLPLPPAADWRTLAASEVAAALGAGGPAHDRGADERWTCAWEISGTTPKPAPEPQTLLAGYSSNEPAAALRVMLAGDPPRLSVELQPASGTSAEVWRGPRFAPGEPFAFQLALASGLGPGGVLWRAAEPSPWSSLDTDSAKGAEDVAWPRTWAIGHGHFGPDHDVWRGGEVRIRWSGPVGLRRGA